MKATKVYSIELLFAMEPQIGQVEAERLCNRLLDGVREYLTSKGFELTGGSARSSTRIWLEAEQGDDVTQLERGVDRFH